jgi:acyl transferase domain-containing protein
MAPSVSGQQTAIQLAVNRSGIDAGELAFWECHAAGTALGDVVELESLDGALFENSKGCQQRKRPLHIGSHKANIGHCFAASGLCTIVKLTKMLSTGMVPPQLLPSGLQNQVNIEK